MSIVGLQTSIWSNRLKTLYLILLLPTVVFLGLLLGYYIVSTDSPNLKFDWVLNNSFFTFLYSLPFIFLWLFIGIKFHQSIIFKFSGAREITRKENPQIYNIVENLAISRGISKPKVGIIDDDSLNAFATGWGEKNRIVFSRGLLKKLNKKEIEAVAGHELTHIINEDVKIMVITTVFIGIIGTVGQILLRSFRTSSRGSRNKKGGGILVLFGLILYLISLIIMPLIQLAISRRREYLADAGSVRLTSDKNSMISALKKISKDSRIESIQKDGVAAMCIANPFAKKGVFTKLKSFFSTHPSIEDRIKILNMY